jgi:large repetitive protein
VLASRPSKAVLLAALAALTLSLVEVPDSAATTAAAPAGPVKAAPVATRPDVVSAAVTARAQGSPVEVLSLRSETSTTWSNPDGTMTTEAHAAPIRYRDPAGSLHDIDLNWQRTGQTSVAPAGHPSGMRLGAKSTMLAAAGGLELTAPWATPDPVLDGTTATYRDVEPGVDLVAHSRRSGFEFDFVVNRRPASVPVWRIPLKLTGLAAKPQQDGSILFVDKDGNPQSMIPAAYMWDATVDPRSGEPANRAKVRLAVDGNTLMIAPDPAWFADAGRVFPITVDPTYAQLTTYTSFDTFVQSDFTTDESASAELKLGTFNGGAVKARSYLNFPTAPFKNKDIRSATLNLWETWSASCTPSKMVVRYSETASTATRWTNQPGAGTFDRGSATVAKGHSASCPGGKVSIPITELVQGWSSYTRTTTAVQLAAADESDSLSWKRFHSSEGAYDPNIVITYNRPPGTPVAPTLFSGVAYAPPGGTTSVYTPYPRPWTQTRATDPDGNEVAYELEFHTSTTPSSATLKATCTSTRYASGTLGGCQPNADLPDNTTIHIRARTSDFSALRSPWSAWSSIRVGTGVPGAPAVSCPYANGSWTDTPPSANVMCTITAAGPGFSSAGYVWATVDGKPYPTNFAGGAPGQIKITPSADPNVAKTTVTVAKTAGLHTIKVQAESPAGRLSPATNHSFGYGSAALSSPAANPRVTTTGSVKIAAAGPPKGASATPTASVRWRSSGYGGSSETTGWNPATSAPVTVTDNGAAGVTVTGTWDTTKETQDTQLDSDPNTAGVQPTVLNDRIPALLDIQVCLTYTNSTQCTWSQSNTTVLRVPHAFGNGFPTADAGPGQVALWTGEFNTEATDITVPGYSGELTLSRSHSTFDGVPDPVNAVFGPGWTAEFDGGDAGIAGAQVIDSTRVDGTIALVDGEGSALVYESPSGNRRGTANLEAGSWLPADEETKLDGAKLTVAGSGASTTLAYTEDDGTVTTFTVNAAPTASTAARFRPGTVTEPGEPSKTTYSYDSSGRVVRILAPVAPGVTCVDGQGVYTNAIGCRSLRFDYGTTGSAAGRLTDAWLDIYNPDKPGMDSIKVAAYTYDASGRLSTVVDPRSGLGTTYGYDSGNRLTSIKPAGQTPFQLSYTAAPDVKLANVKRDRPAGDPAGGTAVLASYVYSVPVTGTGLPDLSTGSVGRWQQASAPTTAFAVFGPDHPVATTAPSGIAAGDWAFADLQYTDGQGYTVNTASFGAGAWQLTATDYNAQGNVIRTLDERALRAIADGQVAAGTEDQLATLTVYNADILSGGAVVTPAGSLVTDTYGPARLAALRDGTVRLLRPHTRTEFDQGAPNAGINTATGLPYRLETTETTFAHDPGTGTDVEAVTRTLTDYTAPVTGDPDGWALGTAGRVTTDVDLDGIMSTVDITRMTRYDGEGRTIETRQPKSTATDAGTTKTVYYTAGPNSAQPVCGSKPQWAGLACTTFPAAAPSSGPPLPSTVHTGYSYLLAPTTVVETSGTVTRTETTSYLTDGRIAATATSVSGLPGSTPNTRKETEYDPVSGEPVKATARNPDGTIASTVTTAYDAWGRTVSYAPSGEPSTTTAFDAAGRVATVTDANGITRYSYDGTDSAGAVEHRGLTTKVEVTTAGATWSSAGAYDADGNLVTQQLPGGLTRHVDLDQVGEPVGLSYTGWLSWSQDNDIAGRVVREWTPEGAAVPYDRDYSYDAAGRLTQVRDRSGIDELSCATRTYSFDANHNRSAKTTIPGAADGSCATSGGTTVSRAFDTADRPTGYGYDPLGRTLLLPAADAPRPADGDISLTYYDNDLARTISQGGTTTTFSLDALDRRAIETVATSTETTSLVRHYTDTSDNPTWISQAGTIRRYTELIGGDFALTVDEVGRGSLAITNLHGDVVSTVDLPTAGSPATALNGWNQFDEYGNPDASNSAGTGELTYGWLGANQRAVSGAGLTLMGVRLYNPATGLFTSLDPVEGGNANDYTYPADPINEFDLDGQMNQAEHSGGRSNAAPARCKSLWCKIKKVGQKKWRQAKKKAKKSLKSFKKWAKRIWKKKLAKKFKWLLKKVKKLRKICAGFGRGVVCWLIESYGPTMYRKIKNKLWRDLKDTYYHRRRYGL